jgi:hypothetical protein
MKEVSGLDYLIIGGSTKCGTTSLFTYLADHPEICGASFKESRFFLGENEPLESRYRLEQDGFNAYGQLFENCTGRVRMEATPDYLYSPFAAENIHSHIPGAKMVFILRDPVERLVSWYKFAKQRALLDNAVSFEDYVNRQFASGNKESSEQHMNALRQGLYSRYLQNYRDHFDEESLLILHFDELKNDPGALIRRVCQHCGIDPSYYDSYRFEVHNKTQAVKNQTVERLYINIRKKLRFLFHGSKAAMKLLRWFNSGIKYALRLNKTKPVELAISEEMLRRLDAYYAEEKKLLQSISRQSSAIETQS